MSKRASVPWTDLFPELIGRTDCDMTRDSVRRNNGDRHYRVKLRLPHSKLGYVQAQLKPYGFEVTKWTWLSYGRRSSRGEECLKCIRHETGPRTG